MKTLHCLPLLFAGFLFGFSADADELITLKTRPEVTQSMLLWEPHASFGGGSRKLGSYSWLTVGALYPQAMSLAPWATGVGAIVLLSGRYHVTPRAPDAPPGGPGGSGLSGLDLGSLKSSVLLVHHTKDACSATPFAQAEALSARIPMIRANGSDEASSGPPCGLGTNHWFVGMEKAVGEEVVKWLSGKSWQRAVP